MPQQVERSLADGIQDHRQSSFHCQGFIHPPVALNEIVSALLTPVALLRPNLAILDGFLASAPLARTHRRLLVQGLRKHNTCYLSICQHSLTDVVIPAQPSNTGVAFLKFLPQTQDDYATV